MAHYFVGVEKDASLIRGSDTLGTSSNFNLGGDEVLEVGKTFQAASTSIGTIQRFVLQFPTTRISKSMSDGSISSDAKYYLNLYDAGSFELTRNNNDISINVVSQSWVEGDGKLSDDPHLREGVSWRYRTGETGSLEWYSGSHANWGATYYSGSGYSASFSFSKTGSDARIDITDIVHTFISGSVPNEGIVVRRPSAIEDSTQNYGILKFFSSDSHTIFKPSIEAVWDDAVWATGSLEPLDLDELGKLQVYMTSLQPKYKKGTVTKLRVHGRERYPARTFGTSSAYLTTQYFPSASSFYSITDAKTDHTIIPFGSGSKLSCDGTGNYFKLRTEGLEPERYYNVSFKVISGSGMDETIQFIDDKSSFKVVE